MDAEHPDVVQVDPRDPAAFAAWFEVVDAAYQHDRPGEPDWTLREMHVLALDGRPRADGSAPDELRVHLAALSGARVLGAARLELPLIDNRHVAGVDVWVRPDARRRGVGRALLEQLLTRAKEAGRSTVMAELDEPPAQAGRSPGRGFAAAHAFAVALVDVRRDLRLPPDADRLAALESQCRPHAAGYRLVGWRDRTPEPLLADRADLARGMSTDPPLGDLDWHEESWDGDRVRREEARAQAQGRSFVAAGAVHEATGRLVAFTDLGVQLARPERVYQWSTIVHAEHRGHRLGTLVKVAAIRRLVEQFPAARLLSTWNAEANRHMIAVNEALGFQVNGQAVSYQREL